MQTPLLLLGISALGFKRGINLYDYKYSKNKNLTTKEPYLYSSKIYYGIIGAIIYLNPVFILVVIIPKEIYRLEVNLRGLEDEKKTDYYNELL